MLHQLVGNGWIDLAVVDDEGAHRLDRHLSWRRWNVLAPTFGARPVDRQPTAAAHP